MEIVYYSFCPLMTCRRFTDGPYLQYLGFDSILYFDGSLQILWIRHSMSDDGRFQSNDRHVIVQGMLNLRRYFQRVILRLEMTLGSFEKSVAQVRKFDIFQRRA